MSVVPILLVAVALSVSSAVTVEEVNTYFDQVVNTYLPSEIIAAGIVYFKTPNFSHNMQNRTSDGAVINTKVEYHNGNVTGFQQAYRKECQQPIWSSGNLTVDCTMTFPKISAKYSGLFQKLTGQGRSVHILQYPFGLSGHLVAESNVTLSYSPHVGTVAVKRITLKGQKPTIRYETDKEENFEQLSEYFYQKLRKIVPEIFQEKFKPAFEKALQSVPFPKKY